MTYDQLNERTRAFQESRILLTAIELDLFTALGDGAPVQELARRLGTDGRATEMLLNALVALGALEKHDGVYRCAPVTGRYWSGNSPESERTAMMHTVHLWRRWSTLTKCVRAGTATGYEEIGERGDTWIRAFIAAMHRNAAQRAPEIVKAVGAENVRRMLDVGGGSGAYSIAFAQANPALRSEILDLAEVLPIAEGHVCEAGLSGRVATRAGDLRTDGLGEGFDLVFVSAICHMLGPDENADLLRRCFDALAPGGRVVIQDFVLDEDKTSPAPAALFALNMLVGTKSGSSYSEQEYAHWLKLAGFRDIRRVRFASPTGLMIATRD